MGEWHALLTGLGYKLDNEHTVFRQYALREGVGWPVALMLVNEKTFEGIAEGAKLVAIQGAHLYIASVEHLIALKLHALKHSRLSRFFKDLDDVVNLIAATTLICIRQRSAIYS